MTTAAHMATRAVTVCRVNGMPSKGQLTSDRSGLDKYFKKLAPPLLSLTKAVMTSSKADAKALTTELSFCRGDGLLSYKVCHL